MKLNINKKTFIIGVAFAATLSAVSVVSYNFGKSFYVGATTQQNTLTDKKTEILPPNDFWESYTPLNPKSITCSFSYITTYSSFKEKIESSTEKESVPINLTFSGLDTKEPIMGGGVLGASELALIQDDEEEYLIFESSPLKVGNISAFRIDKKTKIASWTKMYAFPGEPPMPMTVASMGYCW